MDIQLLNYIIQPLLGGAAGYITNEYAINMLFKAYTPLKIGGVIPKTREEFISNISRLIEEDIISKDRVEKILMDETFVKNFNVLVADFFETSLYKTNGNYALKELPGFDQSITNLSSILDEKLPAASRDILKILNDEIKIEDVLSKKQIKHITGSLLDAIISSIENTNVINDVINNYLAYNKNLSISDMLNDNTIKGLSANISSAILDTSGLKKNSNINIDKAINEILINTNAYSLLSNLIIKAINKNYSSISTIINMIADDFITSKNGQSLANSLSNSLIDYAKTIKLTISDLINPVFFDKLKLFISKYYDDIANLFISFSQSNDIQLHKIIVDAIEETINEQDKTKKALLNMAKGSIIESVEKLDFTAMIKSQDSDKLIEGFVNNIEGFMRKTTIGQLINNLQSKGILKVEALSNLMVNYVKQYLGNRDNIIKAVTLLANKILDLSATPNNAIVGLIKDKIIFNSTLLNKLSISINHEIIAFLNKNIGELLNGTTLDKLNAGSILAGYLKNNKATLSENASSSIYKGIEGKCFCDAINDNTLADISSQLTSYANASIFDLKQKCGCYEIYDAINKINKIDKLQENLSISLRRLIIDNLTPILQGFIKGLSVNNFSKLNDEELCEMAKSFMGNNLKPIMYFGGLLGVIAGIILAVIQPSANILAPFSIGGTLTYALVGFLTNAIAINMLFKPYKEIKLIKNIPVLKHFSVGYIVKNKAVLADSMSHAIDEYLLTKDSMDELFNIYEDKIKDSIIHSISKNNYEAIGTLVNKNKESISTAINNTLLSYISNNSSAINNALISKLGEIKPYKAIVNYEDRLTSYIQINRAKLSEQLSKAIYNFTIRADSIKAVIPDTTVENLEAILHKELFNKYDTLENSFTFSKLQNYCLSYREEYNSLINKSVAEALPFDIGAMISSKLGSVFVSLVSNEELINRFIDNINNIVSQNTKLDKLFNGKPKEIANYWISKFINNENQCLTNLLAGFKPAVAAIVQNSVTKNMNFLVKGAYNMVNGNELVESAVEKVLIDKLPALIENKKKTLLNNSLAIVNDKILKTEISEFDIRINSRAVKATISQYLENNCKQEFQNLSYNITSFFKDKAKNTALVSILAPLSLDSVDNIFSKYKTELNDAIVDFNTTLKTNKNVIAYTIDNFIRNIVTFKLDDITINSIFKDINILDIDTFSSNAIYTLLKDEALDKAVDISLQAIFSEEANINIFDIIDKPEFESSFKAVFEKIMNDNKFNHFIQKLVSEIFEKISNNSFEAIDNKTKDYLINTVTDASILSLKNNLNAILRDIKFDEIARDQVNAMDPKKIHSMFNSFAGKYFRTLMIYGVFGAIFGINSIAGIALSSAYGIKTLVEKTKRKKLRKGE